MISKLCALAIFLMLLEYQTPTGLVVDSETGAPIVGATVKRGNSSATTGRDGRFPITTGGNDSVVVSKPGFVTLDSPIREDNTYRMTRAGVVIGRIVDDDGRPIRGAQVQAMSYGYQNGRRQLIMRGNSVQTNDRGEFRVFWLEPGRYYVVANLGGNPLMLAPGMIGYVPSNPDKRYVTTYYPGTPDFAEAEAVNVVPGEIDVRAIHMAALAIHRVRVRLANLEVNYTNQVLMLVTIRKPGDLRFGFEIPVRFVRSADSVQEVEFAIAAQPGPYQIGVRVNSGPPQAPTFFGLGKLVLGGGEIATTDIPLSKGASIAGQLDMEVIPGTLTVICGSDPLTGTGITASAPVRADGKFTLEPLFPETYSFRIDGLPGDAYVESSNIFDVASGITPQILNLVVKADGGRISGVVTLSGLPRSTTIVVIPDLPQRSRLDRFKTARTKVNGEFQIRGVAPGNYTVLAFEQLEEGRYQDMEFLKPFEGGGTRIQVTASTETKVRIPII